MCLRVSLFQEIQIEGSVLLIGQAKFKYLTVAYEYGFGRANFFLVLVQLLLSSYIKLMHLLWHE